MIIKNKSKTKFKKINKIISKPQIKGLITKLFTMTPKKPNSALRKVAKVLIKGQLEVLAYIPGEKHTLALHNTVLIKPGKTKDLPGVRYKVIRGALDCKAPLRSSSRSKYGTKRKKKSKYNIPLKIKYSFICK